MVMEAGRELDILIAEKRMGLRRRVFLGQDSKSLWDDKAIFDAMESADLTHLNADDKACCVPYYSTDISSAWEVVEKLALTFELGWLPTDKGLNWDASFGEKRGSEEGTTTYAETAPHAICLAALKTVRDQRKEEK